MNSSSAVTVSTQVTEVKKNSKLFMCMYLFNPSTNDVDIITPILQKRK